MLASEPSSLGCDESFSAPPLETFVPLEPLEPPRPLEPRPLKPLPLERLAPLALDCGPSATEDICAAGAK